MLSSTEAAQSVHGKRREPKGTPVLCVHTFNPICPSATSHKSSRCKVPRRYPGNRLSHPTHRQRRQRWDPAITNSGIWEQSKWNQRKTGLQTCGSDFTVSLLGLPNSASPHHTFLDHFRLLRVSCWPAISCCSRLLGHRIPERKRIQTQQLGSPWSTIRPQSRSQVGDSGAPQSGGHSLWVSVFSFLLWAVWRGHGWACRLWWEPITFIGEGNGSPLQYSCLDTPMDGGAW